MAVMNNRMLQVAFRKRNDDGDEGDPSGTGASWAEAINTDFTQMVDEVFRLRHLVERDANGSANMAFNIWFSYNGSSWMPVSLVSNYIRVAETDGLVDWEDTTQFPGSLGTGTWADATNGCQVDGDDGAWSTNTVNFHASVTEEMEYEFGLKLIGDDVNPGDIIQVRSMQGTALMARGYNVVCSITVDKPVFSSNVLGLPDRWQAADPARPMTAAIVGTPQRFQKVREEEGT
jgi:hypothetical protein